MAFKFSSESPDELRDACGVFGCIAAEDIDPGEFGIANNIGECVFLKLNIASIIKLNCQQYSQRSLHPKWLNLQFQEHPINIKRLSLNIEMPG